MGLHTGEAEERHGNYFGSAVNRAARLIALAHGGQVVASAATADVAGDALPPDVKLVDLGEHLLRDLSRREHVCLVQAPGLDSEIRVAFGRCDARELAAATHVVCRPRGRS
jgi:class 3 adenylate cyclase